MSIREIEVFRAVMTAGTTSKAAALLNISQPAVSQAIRKLENSAGLRLFERVRGRLVPTQEGQSLMAEVDRYYTGFEVIEHRIRSLRTHGLGRIAIAALPALGSSFLPRVIGAARLADRKMQISLQVMSSSEVHRLVSTGQVDFGLMADEMSMSGLEGTSFVRLPGVVVMMDDNPLATRTVVRLKDLQKQPFIALNPEDSARRRLEAALASQSVDLNTVVETPFSNTICELAMRKVGIGVVNPLVAIDYVDRGLRLKPLELDIDFSALLIFRPGKPLSENAKQFVSLMRMQLASDVKYLRDVLGRAGLGDEFG